MCQFFPFIFTSALHECIIFNLVSFLSDFCFEYSIKTSYLYSESTLQGTCKLHKLFNIKEWLKFLFISPCFYIEELSLFIQDYLMYFTWHLTYDHLLNRF